MGKQKVVIKVHMNGKKSWLKAMKIAVGVRGKVPMNGQKSRHKAMKIAVGVPGVESATVGGQEKNQLEVVGDGIDAIYLTTLLRKSLGYSELVSVGYSELVSVDPVPEKKDDQKKNEATAPVPVVGVPVVGVPVVGYYPYPYPYGAGPVYEIRDQNPDCSIMDIKGANILVDPNGEINCKLADFGMAKHITACSSMLSFKGSPYWMAPEVVMNTNGYSLPVDIWSLGCTILEMASAKPPWSQFEGVAAIFKIGNSKDIPEIPDHLSNDAKSFLRLCIRRDPSGRPTALQLLDHPFVREQGTPRHSTSNLTKEVSPYPSDGSRTPLDSSREKPLVNFDAPNIKAHGLLVSNSEEKNTREASARRCMTDSVCSFVDSMTSISSTDFDALDNRAHLGRAYQSGLIVFNSKKKDTREGLSGECLTKSALSFDDSTNRKSLPFDVNLSSFSEHASQDFDDLSSLSDNASQEFDDFDFVGFDYGAGMLPNLKDEVSTREASMRRCMTESVCSLVDSMPSISSTDFDALDNRSHLGRAYQSGPIVFNSEMGLTKLRLVRCPTCHQILQEPANAPVYMCGGCNTVLKAKKRKNDTKDKDLQKPDTNMGKKTELEQDSEDKEAQNSSKEDKEARSLSKEETLSSSGELPLDRNNGSDDKENENSNMNQSGLAHHGNEESSPEAGVDQDKCSLKHNNEGDPNEYAQSNGKYIGGVNLLDEVASPTEPNHHKSAESEVDKSGNCLEEENGGVNFSDEVASSTELNHLGSEESSPVAGAHSEVDENKNCLEQEVVSSTELNNNEIEVSSPVVRAYSEANEHGICNGKQTGGVNISDEVVSSTELNDIEIKVSSQVVVTAHSEANEHKTCMEQNNGRNQSEFGDFKLDCSKNTKSLGGISSSTEVTCQEIEESTPVIETYAQLDENSKSHMSLDQSQKRKLTGFDHVSSVDTLENIAIADCSSEFSITHRDMPNFPTTSNYVYEGSVSSYDGNDDQVPDPYLHRLMELKQPATFAELGMDLDDNKGIIDNLLRFVRDKEIYKNAGKDWKRGYLLNDSPGTDRVSLIAAMANCLEFDIYDLDLTGLTSISELTNVLVSIRNHSLIAIKDFDHWAGKLPHFKTELTLSDLSKIIHGLLSSCGDEQIIVLTTNHNHIDGVDVALLRPLNIDLYIHTSSPQPKALPDGGEIVLLDSSKQKPSVDFDATNNRAYQSDVLVSNSEEKNTRVASRRQCMREGVPSLVDSMELEQPETFRELGMDPDNNKGIISDMLRFIRAKDIYKKAGKDWKRGYLLYDTPGTDRSSLIAAMANRLEFHIYHLDLTGFSSISELRNVLVSIRNRSLIAIIDFDRWAGMLPNLKNELTPSGLSKIIHDLLSSCADEQIIVLTTNHNHIDGVDTFLLRSLYNDLYIHTPSPQPKALPDGGEIVLLDSSEQKPSEDFDATNNKAYQSDVLVSNSEEKNTREASRRQCMPESVPSLVDSTTRISLTDFDALDNNAHLVRAYQSGPIVFNSEKKDTGEGLNRECLTKSALSLDDSTKPRLLPDFDATENKVVKVYTGRGRCCWDSMELEQRTTLEELGMDPENKGIISDLLRFVRDKEEFYKKAGKDWKRGYLYDSPCTDRSSLIAAMANFLEFDIYHLDLTGLTSISELTNVLVSIRNRSLIAIKDFDHWAGKLPDFKTELTLSSLLKIIHGLLSSCGDERIIILTTNHNHNHIGSVDAALLRSLNIDLYIHTSSPQPKALPDGGEIVLLDPSEQKPSVDFDATNNRAYQSDVLVSNSEEKNMREASRRQCMPESVPSLVDSTTRISMMDFDAQNNSAHLVMAYQGGPIVFNSEKKDMREVLSRECLTKSVLSLDDSSKQKSLSDVAVTGKKSHIVRAYESGPVVSFSDDKNGGEALKRECITKSILGLEDLQQHSGGGGDDATKSFCAIYDPGIHTADSLARISFEVLETLPTGEQPDDCVPLLSLGRLTLEDCVQQEKSPDLPRVTQINGVEQRVTKLPRYFGGLTAQSASSSRWPIGLPDGGYIVLLDPLDQSTKHIEYVARADQCSPTLSLAEKKMVRKCRTMSVIFEDNHQHFARRCEGDAKSLGVKRIKNQGIHQWPFFRQKWATRKGYSLGEERPFEVRRLSMDETLDSRLQLIHMSQFARSSPRALALPDGGEIVRPAALSSSEFAATNNRAHLVSQDQSGSTASHYKCKNSRETSDKQGLEDLQQHFGCEHKHALKSLGVSGSMFKSTCKQHWFYWWPGRFENNEQAFDATSNRAHLVKADERGPTVPNAIFLEDLRHQFGARCKDAVKGLHDSLAWKSFKVQDNLPLGEQSNTRRRSLTHKHCVRLKKSQDLPRSMLRDCAGGLAAQSDIGLPDGGHILSLSEKKIVRKTLKRKCRTMSVLSLEDHQQHVGRRWEDTVKFLGAKRICRQLVIHRETTAKHIRRQLGTRRWLFKQSAIGLPNGGHILYLPEKKIVRKTLKRKCRSISVLSLEDHKQHVDWRWEDAAKSHGAKRICRQLGIHHLSTAKRTHKQHGIHQWPFQRSTIGLPDGRHILPLSEKKMVRKTLKRKCRSMSVLSLMDRQQHVDRRWEDTTKNIGAKRICRQLVIYRVSIAKRICRQHGIHHRWPFERDWATMKGYSLGDERPVEVISVSTHAKLVSRLQLIYISWLGRFSPRSSALAGGGEIGGPIALSLSESAATKNIAQRVGQDQSGSAASDSENERTREQGDPEEINATITLDDIRRHYGRRNREDAAASLAISVATFKRKCREFGIKRWPHVRKRKVGRPPDQHGEGNTSTARETPSRYVQTGMEGELVGQNEVANVFQRDFMGGPIALNTESGLIMVSRPPDQHGERNTSTACGMPSRNVETGMEVEPVGQNQEANVFRGDFMYGPIALNTDGLTFPECSDAVAPSQPMSTILDMIPHLTGSSSECAFQVKNQSTQFTANPYPNGLVDPHPQIALTQILSETMESLEDSRNLLAPQKEPLPEGHIFGSVNWTVRSCSDVALSQPMPTIPHTTGCSEYWRNSLALLEEHLLEENDYGSINLTAPSCFDPGPSQPMHTIPHTMPTISQMMPLLTERQDMRSVRLKATYGNTTIKFPLPSGFSELKEEVSKRLEFERGSFKLEYKDEEGDSVLIACDDDVRDYLRLLTSLGNQVIKLFVLDKVPNTTNFCDNCGCDNCRSLKCKRP